MNRKKELTFEEKMTSLERIVKEMELNSTPLDKSIEAFEEGIKLARECNQILESATQKVALIKQSGAEVNSDKIK